MSDEMSSLSGSPVRIDRQESRTLSIKRVESKGQLFDLASQERQALVSSRVRETGSEFFDSVFKVIAEYYENKRSLSVDPELPNFPENECFNALSFGLEVGDFGLKSDALEALYVEALYTIKHKIGATSGEYLSEIQDLYHYAQQSFDLSTEDHQRLIQMANEAKPPVVVLELTVVEAKDLEAKDADGFSDPYCMLGIAPATPLNLTRRNSAAEQKKTMTATDLIPAKFIKYTSVKSNTLDPVWNEKFRIDLDDATSDTLHLDLWDHDEDFSVAESVKKLNEVKGLKGLGRYFKQIAQSARTNSPGNVDDFLGTVDIPLIEIPSTGLDRWYELRGRSLKSKVQGQVHLQLNLATREDRGIFEENELIETRQHRDLMKVFFDFEYSKAKETGIQWSGELSNAAKTILHQHAIQGDITDTQQAICWWLAVSHEFCHKVVDSQLLIKSLSDLDSQWQQTTSLYREDEEALSDSFDHCISYCLKVVQLKTSLVSNGTETDIIRDILVCLTNIYESKIFQRCCPFKRTLKSELIDIIKKSSVEWYQRLQGKRKLGPEDSDENEVEGYQSMMRSLISSMNLSRDIYTPTFLSLVDINHFRTTYKQIYKLLSQDLFVDLETVLVTSQLTEPTDVGLEIQAFKLYLLVRQFFNMSTHLHSSIKESLDIIEYNILFTSHLERWINRIECILKERLKIMVEDDTVEKVSDDVIQSSLSIDFLYAYKQIDHFWTNLRWPSWPSAETQRFELSLAKLMCDGALTCSDLIHDKLRQAGYYDEIGQFDITEELCITMNNMEQIRRILKMSLRSMHFSDAKKPHQESSLESCDNQVDEDPLNTLTDSTDTDLTAKIKQVTDRVADKMRPSIKKFVFHLCWAPEAARSQDTVGDLLNYLDSNLLVLNTSLFRSNFDKILESIWIEVLEEIHEIISNPDEDFKKASWISGRLSESLNILVEFFHADGKGLAMPCLNCTLYEDLCQQLTLNAATTDELVELFFKEKLQQQKEMDHDRFGAISVRAYFNSNSLLVEVVNARNIIPLDANGLSDPYVVVEVEPWHVFNSTEARQTKVVKKCLNPTFNESFKFDVSEDQCAQSGSSIVFTVMDHDLLSANDFAGEAYMSTDSIPGICKQQTPGHSALTPVSLPLMMRSTETNSKKLRMVMAALALKEGDDRAKNFLKRKSEFVPGPQI
jgi:BAI1-associated protein 3